MCVCMREKQRDSVRMNGDLVIFNIHPNIPLKPEPFSV